MTTRTALLHLEPLTYWIRLEDMVPEAGINDRLIEQARRGLLLVQSDRDLVTWIQETEGLLQLVDTQLRQSGGDDYPELVEIARSTPAVDSLRSLLMAMRGPEPVELRPCAIPGGE